MKKSAKKNQSIFASLRQLNEDEADIEAEMKDQDQNQKQNQNQFKIIKVTPNKFVTKQESSEQEEGEESQSSQQFPQYPYTKEDARELFHTKQQHQSDYNEEQAQQEIKQSLLEMEDYGFDFRSKLWDFQFQEDGSREYKKMNRKVYVKFVCEECSQKLGKTKKWTSILGNLEIRFVMQGLKQFWKQCSQYQQKQTNISRMKYPKVIKWMLKLYSQQCSTCGEWAQPYIFKSQLKACEIEFCLIVSQLMNQIQPPKNKGNRKKIVEHHNHKQELCEACQLGICYNIPKSQTVQERKQQV